MQIFVCPSLKTIQYLLQVFYLMLTVDMSTSETTSPEKVIPEAGGGGVSSQTPPSGVAGEGGNQNSVGNTNVSPSSSQFQRLKVCN